jgi:methyl-accepting chemotaxis protein
MLSRMKFQTKVLLLPVLAAIAFVLLVIVNLFLGRENTRRVTQIERGYFPAQQASRDLAEHLAATQRTLQDAASAQDADVLKQVAEARSAFLRAVGDLRRTGLLLEADLDALETAYTLYVSDAEAVTKRIIAEEQGDALTASLEKVRGLLGAVQARVTSLRDQQQQEMAVAFASARGTSVTATRSNVIIAAVCLVVILVLSFWIVRNVMRTLHDATAFVSSAAAEILAVAQQTEGNAADEAAFVDETRRAMDGLVESASAIASGANAVLERAEQSVAANRTIAARISELNTQALKITDVSEVIRGIAEKSDILALNAALEGTKVGEAGRGFALVGAEMRRLAETVAGAVREIKKLANEIREVTQAAVLATEEGQKLASETSQTTRQITMITTQQRTATEQVTQSVNEIQQFTRQALNGSKQTRAAAGDLLRTTTQLKLLVSGSESDGVAPARQDGDGTAGGEARG